MRRPERRNFDDIHAEAHMGEMEASADETAIAEQLLHLLRVRVRRNVEVLGFEADQEVPDRASHKEGLVTRVLQPIKDLQRIRRDMGPRDRMLCARNDGG